MHDVCAKPPFLAATLDSFYFVPRHGATRGSVRRHLWANTGLQGGNGLILNITDRFTKRTTCVVLRRITARSVASAMIEA